MSPAGSRLTVAGLAALIAACAPSRPAGPLPPMPPPAPRDGPLILRVIYPRLVDTAAVPFAESGIASRDSAFVFGTVGRADATLRVNGTPVDVFPTGGWIAWLPLPDDTLALFSLEAAAAGDTARAAFTARLPARYRPPAAGPWIDTTAFQPTGDRWIRPGETVRLSARAAPGAAVSLVLPDSSRVPLVADSTGAVARSWGAVAFDRGAPARERPRDGYVLAWADGLGPAPGHVLSPLSAPPDSDVAWVRLEAVLGADTARARWPLRLGVIAGDVLPVAIVHDDTAGTGATDATLAARPAPNATYHWFLPNGTLVAVSGRWNNQVRFRLSGRVSAWANVTDVLPLPPGTPAPGTDRVARSPRLTPGPEAVVLRLPLRARVPFRVAEDGGRLRVTLYGVAADMDWIQYGGTDPLVRSIAFDQPADDETVVTVDLAGPVWGYRAAWDGTDLLLTIRRPPAIDPRAPLRGRRIALDAGHPPGGSTGPTGVYEADVTLAIARRAAALLEAAGAEVLLVRESDAALGLIDRLRRLDAWDAEVAVSIHANALPDGVNPFENSGTSVYYYHPRSAPLARELNRALVRQFGVRDLGMGRGDLALARPTWMPAALTEGLFMMLPDQEAMLASPEGQDRYARGVVEGLEAFLRGRAAAAAR